MVDDAKTGKVGSSIPDPPKPTSLQKLRDVGVAAVAAVPAFLTHLPIAGPIAALLNAALGQPAEKQWKEWAEGVLGETVRQLAEERGIRPEDLAANPTWQNAARRATEAAMKDARREKWETLHNALVNSALPDAPTDELQHFFFRLIDEFSQTHVRMFMLCMEGENRAPLDLASQDAVPLFDFVRRNLPQPPPSTTIITVFLGDLETNGLLLGSQRGSLSNTPRGRIVRTDVGREFLLFISAPLPPEPSAAAPPTRG